MNRPEEGIDIDTELDWKLAESFLLSQDPSSSTNP
jgi:CMP-N-acetylneuraminic acid synthetase